jgi:hypothetical protein
MQSEEELLLWQCIWAGSAGPWTFEVTLHSCAILARLTGARAWHPFCIVLIRWEMDSYVSPYHTRRTAVGRVSVSMRMSDFEYTARWCEHMLLPL